MQRWCWLTAILLTGCGGSDTPPPSAVAPPAAQPIGQQPAAPVAQPPAANPAPAVAAAQPSAAHPAPVAAPPAVPTGPPSDLSAWQADDFRFARAGRDARLPEAVEQLLKRPAGDASQTQLLIELLTVDPEVVRASNSPPTATAPPAAPMPGAAPAAPPLLPIPSASGEAILRSLASAQDETAHAAVVDVLYGRRLTPLEDQRALEVISAAWATTPHAASRDLLFQMLTEPTDFRGAKPEDSNPNLPRPVPAKTVQTVAWSQIQSALTADLRLRLTDHLAKKTTSKADHEMFDGTVLDRRADNLDCWLKMFGNRAFDERTRQLVESYLAADARWLSYQMLGVPADADASVATPTLAPPPSVLGGVTLTILGGASEASSPPQATPEVPEDQMAAYLARRLWQPELVDQFVKQAGDSPARLMELTRVLTRFPTDHSRKLLFEASQRLGPKAVLSAAGDVAALANLIYDPGLLPIIKQVPRDEDPTVHDARLGKTKKPNPRARNAKAPAEPTAVDPKLKSRYDWLALSEAAVQTWNRRIRAAIAAKMQGSGGGCPATVVTQAAAEGPAEESSAPAAGKDAPSETPDKRPAEETADEVGGGKESGVDADPFGTKLAARTAGAELPVTLHEGARVIASYRLICPDEVASRLPGVEVAPLALHYVCVEGEGRANALLGHYREQLKGAKVRPLADFGRWVDYLGPGSQPGRKRSIDVMITLRDQAAIAAATQAAADKEKGKDKPRRPEPLRIEILCVEINQPGEEALAGAK